MTWGRPLLAPLLAAILLLQGIAGPVRCLAALGPLAELAAITAFCGPSAADPHHPAPHRPDHVCAVCCGLGHAVVPEPPIAPLRQAAWFVPPQIRLSPREGPVAPRAPPLQPRAPPALS